jgi:hypothetical protein
MVTTSAPVLIITRSTKQELYVGGAVGGGGGGGVVVVVVVVKKEERLFSLFKQKDWMWSCLQIMIQFMFDLLLLDESAFTFSISLNLVLRHHRENHQPARHNHRNNNNKEATAPSNSSWVNSMPIISTWKYGRNEVIGCVLIGWKKGE